MAKPTDPQPVAPVADVIEGWPEYRKTTPIRAKKMATAFEVKTINGNMATGEAGDYLAVNPENLQDVWPVKADVFEATHEPVERISPLEVRRKAFKTLIDNLGDGDPVAKELVDGACRTLLAIKDVDPEF